MTECSTQQLTFARHRGRKVLANFNGGHITADAGLLLVREADRQLGLLDRLAACLSDWRDPARITHELRTMLAQRVLAIAAGYEDGNDHQTLRDDPLMKLIVDAELDAKTPLASPSTLCRFENHMNRASMIRVVEALVEAFIQSHDTEPPELILDFDATDDPLHGQQEGRFFHGYYDQYCYLPLYVFCGDQLLVPYLRPSNIDASKHTGAILKLLVKRLREAFPNTRLILRGDSGFCRWRLMRWCDRNDVGYVLGLARNNRLLALAEPWLNEAQHSHEQDGGKHRIFGEFEYAAGTWDRARRVIAKAEHGSRGANPRFIVTNLPPGDELKTVGTTCEAQRLYENVYCQRGEMENRIKEQQLGLFATRTSCSMLLSNQFRLLLSSIAYVLLAHVRRVALRETELAGAQVETIRRKLLKIGARIVISVRRVVLHLAEGWPWRELLIKALGRLQPNPP